MDNEFIQGVVVVDFGIRKSNDKEYIINKLLPQIQGILTPVGKGKLEYPGCPKAISRYIYNRQTAEKQKNDYPENSIPTSVKDKIHAVEFLGEICANTDITIVSLGTLTNVAIALRIIPEIGKHIREIVVLEEGGFPLLPCLQEDPEAGQIVLQAGIPVSFLFGNWENAPVQRKRLKQPGKCYNVCLSHGNGAGMLIPDSITGNIRIFMGGEATCVY